MVDLAFQVGVSTDGMRVEAEVAPLGEAGGGLSVGEQIVVAYLAVGADD
jgi:hypothetical protein